MAQAPGGQGSRLAIPQEGECCQAGDYRPRVNTWKEAPGVTRIGTMSSNRFFRIVVLSLIVTSTIVTSTLFAFAQEQDKRGRKYKAPPETMKVDITVVRASSGKPIPNAAVIFHPVNEKGKVEG